MSNPTRSIGIWVLSAGLVVGFSSSCSSVIKHRVFAPDGGAAGEGGDAGARVVDAGAGGVLLAVPEAAGAGGADDVSSGAGGVTTAVGGGVSSGGVAGTPATAGGGGSASDCSALAAAYQASLEKARQCDQTSTTQCSKASTLLPLCGCPVLVNAESEFTTTAEQQRQAITDAGCVLSACPPIACLTPQTVACASQPAATAMPYLCTGQP